MLYPLSYEGGSRLRLSGRRSGVAQSSLYLSNSIVAGGLGGSDMSTRLCYSTAGSRLEEDSRMSRSDWDMA